MSDEQRGSTLRRQVNSIGMRDGELQESRLWAQLGKALCAWLIVKHAEALIGHWEVLLVLIGFLIAPEIAKKAITMRFGNTMGGGFTRRVERESSTETQTPIKPIGGPFVP